MMIIKPNSPLWFEKTRSSHRQPIHSPVYVQASRRKVSFGVYPERPPYPNPSKRPGRNAANSYPSASLSFRPQGEILDSSHPFGMTTYSATHRDTVSKGQGMVVGAQRSYAMMQLIDDFLSCFFAGAHAVGNADAVVGAAGLRESGKSAERGFDSLNPCQMTYMILGHRVRMAPNARKNRLCCDA